MIDNYGTLTAFGKPGNSAKMLENEKEKKQDAICLTGLTDGIGYVTISKLGQLVVSGSLHSTLRV